MSNSQLERGGGYIVSDGISKLTLRLHHLPLNHYLERGLDAAGADAALKAEIVATYAQARTQAFRAGMVFLAFVALAGLIMIIGLSDRKLVET